MLTIDFAFSPPTWFNACGVAELSSLLETASFGDSSIVPGKVTPEREPSSRSRPGRVLFTKRYWAYSELMKKRSIQYDLPLAARSVGAGEERASEGN
jgi:hypothetical protein